METELGMPMLRAVVVKKVMTAHAAEFEMRYFRGSVFDEKKKVFKVTMHRGASEVQRKYPRYKLVEQLQSGDELYISPDGTEWSDPVYHGTVRRWLNLRFA